MGAQLLLIDTIRSATFESAQPRPTKSSAEPTGRFDDYLDEAQSAGKAATSEESEEASESSEEHKAKNEEKESPDDADQQVVRAAQTDQELIQSVAIVGAETDSSAKAEVISEADRRNESQRDVAKSVDFKSTSGEAESQPKQDASNTPARIPTKTEDGPATPHKPAEQASTSKEREPVEKTDPPVVREQAVRAREADSSHTRQVDSHVQKTVRQIERGDALPKEQPVVKTQEKPVEPLVRNKDDEDGPRPVGQRETVYQRKVKDSIEDRREGSANGQSSGNAPKKGLLSATDAVTANNDLKTAGKVEAALGVRSLSVSDGQGDSAAAAIARFLIAGRSDASGAATTAQTATPPANVTGGTAALSQAISTNIVGELLTARVESQESVDAAARVLSASGGSGRYQVTMQLDPPELGHLKLQIRMHQQGMTLHVDTETQGVARLIESRLSELREALAAHGIRIERADVVVKSPDTAESDLQQRDQHSPYADTQRTKSDEQQGGQPEQGWNRTADDQGRASDHAGSFEEPGADDAKDDIRFEEKTIVNKTRTTESSLDLVA